ncbi:MAG TPA: hypothetical protein DD490_28355 [Acidobacteria bacterium]|nr:hypothetical protein [Acidobacteriota bacterium]
MRQSGEGFAAPAAPVQASALCEAVPPPARSRPREFLIHLEADVREALPDLPERFTGAKAGAALGRRPERASLRRALHRLLVDGDVVLKTREGGRHPSLGRQTEA